MIYRIITEENKILRQRASTVADPLDPKIQSLIPELIKTMIKEKGVGLAAPQVGQSIRLAVINVKDNPLVLINPKITFHSIGKESGEEGCLSVPGVFGPVKRAKKVRVSALDKQGKKITVKGEGFLARVLQHEIDHLNGILFIDKIAKGKKEEKRA